MNRFNSQSSIKKIAVNYRLFVYNNIPSLSDAKFYKKIVLSYRSGNSKNEKPVNLLIWYLQGTNFSETIFTERKPNIIKLCQEVL